MRRSRCRPSRCLASPSSPDMATTRRDFLRTASAAAVVAGLPTFAADASKKRLSKGIMYSTIGVGGSIMEKFKAAKEAGFEGVEAMSHEDQDEVMKAKEATGLEIPSVCGRHH